MREIEISAKTIEDAMSIALAELDVPKSQVQYEVLKKGRAGMFGIGAEDARIKVWVVDTPAPASAPSPTVSPAAGTAGAESGNVAETANRVLSDLLRLMNVDAGVKQGPVTPETGITLNVEGNDLGSLIGRRGQTLASLQFVVRLIVSEKTGKWHPITVDVSGYKEKRRESLQRLAMSLAEQVKTTRRSVSMEPMPPDERRIIHLTLAENDSVITQSFGEGEERKVVIQPKKR
jgi:spoIIIJ-associated protein